MRQVGIIVALLASHASAESLIAYIGSGGCDAPIDPTCKDDKAAEHVMRAVELSRDGAMTERPDLAVKIGGLPVWMATSQQAANRCLFVTRAETDDLQAFVASPSGALTGPVSTVKSGGRTPVFAAATKDGKTLLVANYNAPDDTNVSNGAAASSFQINADCTLKFADTKYHNGSSVDPQRQGGAHVHSFVPVRGGIAYACDLGMDMIFTYKVSPEGHLTELHRTRVNAGFGPRHLVQHPTKDFIYVVTEMGESVLVYKQMPGGVLEMVQANSLVPEGYSGVDSKAAEIAILPDGSALYATNRGKLGSVTVFGIGPSARRPFLADGELDQRQQVFAPVSPGIPRGMTLAFNGSMLLLADQRDPSDVVAFSVEKGGLLTQLDRFHSPTGVPPHPAAFALLAVHDDAVVV